MALAGIGGCGLAGCGGASAPGDDAAVAMDGGVDGGMSSSDTGPGTTDAGADAGASVDAGLDAASTTDAGDDASTSTDTGPAVDAFNPHDAAPSGDADIAACDYVAVDEVIVLCGADYVFVSHFTSSVGGGGCRQFWAFDPDGEHFANAAAVIASDGTCDPTCEWHFATSVSRIYCGHRDGYETLSATGCADIYRFAEGYYPSVEAHDAANPCP